MSDPRALRSWWRLLAGLALALGLIACGGGGGGAREGAAGAASSADFTVHATAGLGTGLVKLAHTETLVGPVSPSIDWGDGSSSPVLLDCTKVLALYSCDYWNEHTYAAPGTYPVTVDYGLGRSASATAAVSPVGNFVILSIGDSVASGEGNPVVPARVEGLLSHAAYWDSPNDHADPGYHCHISSRAGPALAAGELQAANPGTSVTFLHLACSGDRIGGATGQLAAAAAMLPPGQPIDALLISAGANDVDGGFSNVVETCLGPLPPERAPDSSVDCSTDATFRDRLASDIAGLDYGAITRAIAADGLAVADVYITEYFDPTHDAFGNYPGPLEDATCTGGLLKEAEWSFLHDDMVVPLDAKVAATSALPPVGQGWHVVGGIAADFLKHGYCADPDLGNPTGLSWVIKAPESLRIQEDLSGTAHPNASGHADYQRRIVEAVNAWTPPETTATATAGGVPYAFGTWTSADVSVSLSATNKLATAGTGATYFAVDDPACGETEVASCSRYTGPIPVTTSGVHLVSFFSANASGHLEKVRSAEVRIDRDPPVMTCTATPASLWPPDGKMVPVTLAVTAVDAVFGPSPFALRSIATSEGDARGDVLGFDVGLADTDGWLRATRLGTGPGRTYRFTYESADPLGNTGTCTVDVAVPHDQR